MSIEDVMLEAQKFGYQIDEKTVKHNFDYFKHNLNMCVCALCQCGNCQCKNPRFQLSTSYRKRSLTPKVSVRDTPITVSRSFYETFENSYRQMQGLPNQFVTSNQRQYRGFSLTGTPVRSSNSRVAYHSSFEGSTRYQEFFADKPKQKNVLFKRPYERHTGPLKIRQLETQNQKVYQRLKIEPQPAIFQQNQMDQVLKVNLSIPMKTMYQSSFREMPDLTQSVDRQECKKRKQEDLQCINQIILPFQAKSVTSQQYRNQPLFVCPAKLQKYQ
ncbi:unnamed protein product [Paramecium octaurelia]|uniref:Uncharacterized protein n=1 Tax=Paramecium octaurelia TaxID=43137 RepID=A0A8S1S6D8_PAROT|nr:unnamed protein product [Paramecium octaurelia]